MSFLDDVLAAKKRFDALNPTEKEAVKSALLKNPFNVSKLAEAQEKAESWVEAFAQSEAVFGKDEAQAKQKRQNSKLDGPLDAVRHCYWTALLCRDLGYNDGLNIVVTHEMNKEWGSLSCMMDLHNDAVGAEIGRRNSQKQDNVLQIETLLAVQSGKLVILDKDKTKHVKLTSLTQER